MGRTLPLGQTESYSYDAAGNLQSKTDFNGHTTTYAYDNMNRLLSKTADPFFSSGACANGACGATQVSFTYNNLGQRATMTDATGKTTYGYDSAARLISVATPLANLSYNYDKQNNQTTTSWSGSGSGGFSTYTYDALNRLQTVSDTNTVAATASYAYDPVGNLSSVTYGNNIVHSYTYDVLNRLADLSLQCGTTTPNCGPGGATQAASYAYTLGPAGNRTGVTELSGRTVTYGYDDLYRLTSETIANATSQNGTIGYIYDSVGNRKQITSTVNAIPSSGTLLYDANDRTATDTYDNNGNTVAQGGITNVYDFENHLVQHGAITIVYDGDGNRVAETVGGVTTKYLVDSNNLTGYAQVRAEFQNGQRVRAYMYGLERLAEVQTINNIPNTVNYYGYDGHGSVRNLMSTSGAVTDTYDYDAFGNLVASTGSTPNNYLFAGEQFDRNLGLYYNRARYVDVVSGRFWGMDTEEGYLEEPLSLHKYLYTGGNPVDRLDPSGNEFDIASLSISIAVSSILSGGFGALAGAVDRYLGGGNALQVADAARNGAETGLGVGVLFPIPVLGAVVTGGFLGLTLVGAVKATLDNNYKLAAFRALMFVGGSVAVLSAGLTNATVSNAGDVVVNKLLNAADQAVQQQGPGSGGPYGTFVHTRFANIIKSWGDPNFSTEVSYKGGVEVSRGTAGSIRCDVVYGPRNAPWAIYDLKTGDATLDLIRVQEIQSQLPGGSNVPVIELKPR